MCQLCRPCHAVHPHYNPLQPMGPIEGPGDQGEWVYGLEQRRVCFVLSEERVSVDREVWQYMLASAKLRIGWSRTHDTRPTILALAFKASASSSHLIQSLTAGPVSMSHMYCSTQSRNSFSAAPRSMGSDLCGSTLFCLGALHVNPLQQLACLIQL